MIRVKSLAIAFVLIAGISSTATAAKVTLTVHNVDSEPGDLKIAICDQANFLTYHCPFRQHTPAVAGDMTLVVDNVPPGQWAAIAYHDVNMNGVLDRNFLGIPTEQFGFTNDPGYNHEPKFSEAEFTVGETDRTIEIKLSN